MPATDAIEPPQPPTYRRVVRLGALEWVGIPLLAVLPLLSLTGLLGPSQGRLSVEAPGPLTLELTHPSRLRHKGGGALEIVVINTGTQPAQALSVALDAAYLSRFSRAEATPAAEDIAEGRVRVPLPPLEPGARTNVHLRLEAKDWGRLPGWVELGTAQRPALARLDFSTLVLP